MTHEVFEDYLDSLIADADSYKYCHDKMIRPGTKFVSSYIESRGGRWDKTVFFGLQMYLKKYLSKAITAQDVEAARDLITAHGLPFNYNDWMIIVNELDGKLPISISAVPEGTVIANKNVLVQVINTDERFAWLTSFVETALLRAIWYPTSVATLSWHIKQVIRESLIESSDNAETILPFKLHDFGARGATCKEAAGIGGAAHLVNFMGSDTVTALIYARRYYHCEVAGYSIPATEHSVMSAYGGLIGEPIAMKRFLDQFLKPGSIAACVSDTYNIWKALDMWGGEFKEQIMNSGGTLVVRPDSGDPVQTPVAVIRRLLELFGYTVNSRGYKVLPNCIRVIQGDGVNEESIKQIIDLLLSEKISIENLAFGCGGALLQKVDRDTLKFAQKASAGYHEEDGWYDIFKDPITDKVKSSKKGRLALVKRDGNFVTIRLDNLGAEVNHLEVVWENGELLIDDTFAKIRARSNAV